MTRWIIPSEKSSSNEKFSFYEELAFTTKYVFCHPLAKYCNFLSERRSRRNGFEQVILSYLILSLTGILNWATELMYSD
jgi:hypothetical protein